MKPLFVFIGLTCLFGCGTPQDKLQNEPPPNIIWIVAEDISPALGCYGDGLARTPNIDWLASEGIRFDKAYATAPICAPSRSCLMTGLYATALGTQHLRCEIPFPTELQTLPEHLRKVGYFTSNRNKTDYNFDPEGRWDHWSGSIAPWRYRKDQNRPFFSFINVGPSHEGSANRIEKYREAVQNLPEDQLTDTQEVKVPPYYPDTEGSREVWAHYYDLLHVMDANVGDIIDSLKVDGELENTIVFFFGDHGFGMPRYKRWLYQTGLRVPLVIRLPERYRHLAEVGQEAVREDLVSFVDFAPTALNLAGATIPGSMQGQPFLGKSVPSAREFVFGARDRADDMFEMSRAVLDNRYIYIRHYMPHLPYIQPGFIFSEGKHAFRVLNQARSVGLINEEQQKLWNTKPAEELYDLLEDPAELNNLADSKSHLAVKNRLKEALSEWGHQHRDLGFLPEAEYMIRSEDSSPYSYGQSPNFDLEEVMRVATLVGFGDREALLSELGHVDSGARFWAVVGLMNLTNWDETTKSSLEPLLEDPSPSVQIQAAEAICRHVEHRQAIAVLDQWVQDDRPWVALQAARSIQLIGDRAKPLIPIMYKVLEKNLGEPGKRLKYKDFNFAAFTSWALEWALQEMGEEIKVN